MTGFSNGVKMVSFVIPIYNASKILQDNYQFLKKEADFPAFDYEIIFEDDASSDESREILEKIARNDPHVTFFSHHPNQGLGFTLRHLFNKAAGDVIVYLDVDLPFGTAAIPRLIKEAESADVVLASRYAETKNKIPFAREAASSLYYFLCKALFGIKVRDLGSGCVVFKKRALDDLRLNARGFDIHIELFAQFENKGFRIKEIPLRYIHNGRGTFSILKHGPRIFIDTLKLWLSLRKR